MFSLQKILKELTKSSRLFFFFSIFSASFLYFQKSGLSILLLSSIILGMAILGQLYDVQGIAAAFVLANTAESIFLVIVNKFYKIKEEQI